MDISKWTRWMHASVASYLKSVAATIQVPAFAEGLEERTKLFQNATDRIEIRVNGPYTKKLQGLYEARLLVNVLVTSNLGERKNAFSMLNTLGTIHNAMDANIPLFMMGDASESTEFGFVQIGCLQPVNQVQVYNFGQITPEDRTRQGMVTCAYIYYFDRE